VWGTLKTATKSGEKGVTNRTIMKEGKKRGNLNSTGARIFQWKEQKGGREEKLQQEEGSGGDIGRGMLYFKNTRGGSKNLI